MTTKRDLRTRTVLSWLRDDAHENAERVLLLALDEVDATPQRRSWWPAWRDFHMNKLALTAAAVTTVLVGAVVGSNLLPGLGIVGPGATPSPSPALLARGSFVIRDWGPVEFEATREGSSVTGRMEIGMGRGPEWPITVDLQCTETTDDGLIMIGGYTDGDTRPVGNFAAIALGRAPVRAAIAVGSGAWTPVTGCLANLDAWLNERRMNLRDDIAGTVEFGP